ncbi:hypothetical protein [Parabacteroides sp.]
MKTTYFFLIAALLCCTTISCSKDEYEPQLQPKDYAPGEIPGLGEAEGELTGTPFKLPDGVELTGEITGSGDQDGYWNLYGESSMSYAFTAKDGTVTTRSFAPKTRAGENVCYSGSGYGYVDLLIPMRNSQSSPVTVTFPAALILRNDAGNRQNGVLIKKVTVTIPAGADYHLNLAFYCGNAHKGSAGSSDHYSLGVVSDAKPLLDLCDRVKDKKINIEEFDPTDVEDYNTYNAQRSSLQNIVWLVTDDTGLTETDISYINSLPNSR